MKTYWDHTEKERSELTEEGVKELLKFELMMKGVQAAKRPTLQPLKPVEVERVTVYEVENVYFETIEAAQKFLELKPLKSEYEWAVSTASEFKYAAPFEKEIKCTTLARQGSIVEYRNTIRENEAVKKTNEKLEREYTNLVIENDKVTQGVWEDWFECKDKASRYEKICKMLEDYEEMTGGNQGLAHGFLLKIYPSEDIDMAKEWCYGRPVF